MPQPSDNQPLNNPTPPNTTPSAKTPPKPLNPPAPKSSSPTPPTDPTDPAPTDSTPAPSVFTKIIAGEIPSYKIYADDKTYAFLDINPETRGHTLVVPKLQVDKIYDLPDDYYQALMQTAKKLSQHLEQKLGTRIIWKVIGTDVPHAHIHLEPLDDTWFHGRHLSFTPEEFTEIQHILEFPEN